MGTLVFSRVGTRVWLYGLIFIGCGSICAGRLKTAVSFVGAAVFFIGTPSRKGPDTEGECYRQFSEREVKE